MKLEDLYTSLSNQATTAEAGGLAKERAVLLLWFLRNVVGLDDLDAYEYVCDGDDDAGIDGLYLEPGSDEGGPDTLVVFQSKYTQAATKVGESAIDRLVSVAHKLKSKEGLEGILTGAVEPQLVSLLEKFRLADRLDAGDIAADKLRIRLVLVTSGVLNGAAKRAIEAVNIAQNAEYLVAHDLRELGPLASAMSSPQPDIGPIRVRASKAERMVVGQPGGRVAVASVRGIDIAEWPGVDDRTLFDLNVRRELPRNRVRRQLDAAIDRTHDHADFLAYHNGLTVTCLTLEEVRGGLLISGASVVNGAQSVVALRRGLKREALTDELRIVVKFVEVAGRPQLAKEVSVRSNTQNPVNTRNLVAFSGPQRRLEAEFTRDFSHIYYETRPDASENDARRRIRNDDAAQLLCALFNAEPWTAVKRNSLFESDNHAMIFHKGITPAHVVFADEVARSVEREKERFPEEYRKSWKLTKIVAVYLIGSTIRVATADEIHNMLQDPASALKLDDLATKLDRLARFGAATLRNRRNEYSERPDLVDSYGRDFKNPDQLRELRKRVRESYVVTETVDG